MGNMKMISFCVEKWGAVDNLDFVKKHGKEHFFRGWLVKGYHQVGVKESKCVWYPLGEPHREGGRKWPRVKCFCTGQKLLYSSEDLNELIFGTDTAHNPHMNYHEREKPLSIMTSSVSKC